MSMVLSPSLLSANFADLARETANLEAAGISWLHLDVMDGHFVPNITFGPPLIQSLRKCSSLFFDVHLMIDKPGDYIKAFADSGADLLVVHLESLVHAQRVLELVHSYGKKAGLALNPGTNVELCRWLLPDLDLLLLMSVNPGFSGQKFIPCSLDKVRQARDFLNMNGYGNIPIQVDGGVSAANAADLVRAGASVLVSGSAFFGKADYALAKRDFDLACEPARCAAAEDANRALHAWTSQAAAG